MASHITDIEASEPSFDEFDEINSPRPLDTEFDAVVDEAISRRDVLGGILAFGTVTFLLGTSSLTSSPAQAKAVGRTKSPFCVRRRGRKQPGYDYRAERLQVARCR